MNKKRVIIIAVLMLFVGGILLALPQPGLTEATAITPATASVSSSVDYCFGFDIDNDLAGTPGDIAAGDYFSIEFASDFGITNLAVATEVSVYLAATDCTGTERVAEASAVAANDQDLAEISGDKLTITMEDAIDTTFSIEFHDEAADGSVDTPASAGNYQVTYEWGTGTTVDGQDADILYIGAGNEVTISGTVDPSLSLTLADWTDSGASSGTANTCDLGTLSTTNISTCSYSAAISTNATSGYTASISEDAAMTSGTDTLAIGTCAGGDNAGLACNADGDCPSSTCTDITVVTGNSATTEAYGISTSLSGQTITQVTDADTDPADLYNQDDCDALTGQSATNANAAPLTTSDQSFASATAPATDTAYICHAATIAGDTPAGLYSHTVTITVVGNF